MKVKTNLALIIDNQRIEAGSTINIDDATYPSIAAYVTVLEPAKPTTPSTQGVDEPPQAESVDEVAEAQTAEAEAVAGMAEVTEDKPKRKRA